MNFLFKIKQDKFLNGHITYQSHMSISKLNLLHMLACDPFSFAKLFVTLGDRDHVHPHIHANSYTGSYAKHAIHPPKISTPSSKEISLLAKGERGH
jgi:hypothetical protein